MRWLLILTPLLLQGCVSGLFAGSYSESIAINPKTGDVLLHPITRQPIKLRKRTSKTVGVAEQGAIMVGNAKSNPSTTKQVDCYPYSAQEVTTFPDDLKSSFVSWQMGCIQKAIENKPMEIMGNALLAATGGNVSDAQAIAQNTFNAVLGVERESTNKVRAVANPLAITLGVRAREKTAQVTSQEFSRTAIAASETGNVEIGSITTHNSNSIGNSSNDPVGGAGGEVAGGAATSTVTNTIASTPETSIFIGRGNRQFINSDSGRFNVADENIQAIEPSATANLNGEGGRQNGQITADEQNGAPTNEDNDGGNGLF